MFTSKVNIDHLPISSLIDMLENARNPVQDSMDEIGLTGVLSSTYANTAQKHLSIVSQVLKAYPANSKKTNLKHANSTGDPFYVNSLALFRKLSPDELLCGLTDYAIIQKYLSARSLEAEEPYILYQQGINPLADSPDGSYSGIHEYASELFNGNHLFDVNGGKNRVLSGEVMSAWDEHNYRGEHEVPHEMFQEACELMGKKDAVGLTPAQRICARFNPEAPKISLTGIKDIIQLGADLNDEVDGVSIAKLVQQYSNLSAAIAGEECRSVVEEAVKEKMAENLINNNQAHVVAASPRRRL